MRSIFRKRNPDVEALFEEAGRPEKVMCVPFDYAKKTHTAMVCNGAGHKLRGVFNVENNRHGLDCLLGIVSGLCRKHKIRREHVFFGGEDCGSYAFNFIHALVSRGFLVVGMNTKQAKDEREGSEASTDLIHTVGVAGMIIKMRGRTIGLASEQVHGLRRLRRQRGAILKAHAASAHRMYRIGMRWAPGLYAELGDPLRRRSVHAMAALGGVVPRIKQSGGPDSPACSQNRLLVRLRAVSRSATLEQVPYLPLPVIQQRGAARPHRRGAE